MKRILLMTAAIVVVLSGSYSPKTLAATNTTKAPSTVKSVAAETDVKTVPDPINVTVEKGDSLSKIAVRYNTTWVRIFNANDTIENPDIINPGDVIRIPRDDEELPERNRPQPAPVATSKPVTKTRRVAVSTSSSVSVEPSDAKSYIYSRESGNNPNSTSSRGCYGLGQDCNGVVRDQCGADYACQDEFFTNYAIRRYGSWEGALAFWQNHHWW